MDSNRSSRVHRCQCRPAPFIGKVNCYYHPDRPCQSHYGRFHAATYSVTALMNLRDLRYLLALAEHRHFGRAAAASFVSQPTLSTQIRKLEAELDTPLFERAPRRVLLTPAGREIAERARRVIGEVEQIGVIARRSRDPEAGTLRLGIFPTLAPYLLPHVVPKLRARFPRLELLLAEEKTDQVLAQLREGRLDAGLLALPVEDPQLHVEALFTEPFVLAVPRGHALADAGAVDMADLQHQDLLLLEEGHCLRAQALAVCERAGAGERGGFRATSLETLRQMVSAGVGMTLLPALAVQPPVPRSDDIRLLPFRGKAPSRDIALVWRRSSAMAALLDTVAVQLRGLPAALLEVGPAVRTPRKARRSPREPQT